MAVISHGEGIGGRLPRGPHPLSSDQVDADQRQRLVEAMILEVAERGYAASTVAGIIERAGISRKTFYAHYPSREELLLAAFDLSSSAILKLVQQASRRTGGSTRRLESAMRRLCRSARESPGAIALCTVDIAAANPAGLARREQLMGAYGGLIQHSLASGEARAKLPTPLQPILAGGVHRVIDARLRSGRARDLNAVALELARWVRSYHPPPTSLGNHTPTTQPGGWSSGNGHCGGRAPGTLTLAPADYTPPPGKRSRGYVAHTNRERIVDAVARLTAEQGYPALSALSIATDADVPERAFLAQFSSKDDAFAAACEIGHAKGQAIVARAREHAPTWRGGVSAAVTGLLDFLASEPLFTHMAFIDAPLAGPGMAHRTNQHVAAYARLLLDGAPRRRHPPALAAEAIAHSLFELAFTYAASGRTSQLPAAEEYATYLALAPFLGVTEAGKRAD
jgi:AcrR family transcriptional regulator